jgi:hypothetical protein
LKLGIKITVFLILMVGRLGVGEPGPDSPHTPTVPATTPSNLSALTPTQPTAPAEPRVLVNQFAHEYFKIDPFTKEHLGTMRELFSILSNPSTSKADKFGELVQKTAGFFPASSEFSQESNRGSLVQALQSFAASTDKADKAALELIASRIKDKEQILKVSEQGDEKKEEAKVAQDKAAKEKAAQDAQLQAIQQQALLAAAAQAQQGNQGGGGSGSGSGSGSNSKGSSSPQSPSSSNDSQPKHDNLADQLSKAFSQNNQNQNLSSMFNNNNSSSSSSSSEKKKEDGFKFDVTPKTTQNEVKPAAKNTLGDNNAAVDPSTQGFNPSLQNVLSGPTSVPQLMSQASPNNPFALGGEGGGGGQGFSGNIKSNGGGSDGGNAQEIFSGVGKVDYGELPPPIRKASPDFGGEGGGFGENGEGGGGSTTSPKANKKESLINELVLMTDNPRAKGRGIMAFVGVQVKDVCTKPGLKKIGVCGSPKQKNRFERVSVFK